MIQIELNPLLLTGATVQAIKPQPLTGLFVRMSDESS